MLRPPGLFRFLREIFRSFRNREPFSTVKSHASSPLDKWSNECSVMRVERLILANSILAYLFTPGTGGVQEWGGVYGCVSLRKSSK